MPSAQALVSRFERPLSQIIDAALAGSAEAVRRLGGPGSFPATAPDCPPALMLKAVRAAALEIDDVVTPARYDAWHADYIARRRKRGDTWSVLPSAHSIANQFGSWGQALADAGLAPTAVDAGLAQRGKKKAPPAHETLDRCIDATGVLPTRSYVERWCQRMDIPLGGEMHDWPQVVRKLRDLRSHAGKWTPSEATPPRRCPDFPAQLTPAVPARATCGVKWTREKVLEGLVIYGREYLRGARPTQRHYRAAAKGDPRLAAPSTLSRFGRIQDLFAEAGL